MQPRSDTHITVTRDLDPGEVIDLYAAVQWGTASDYDVSRVRRALDKTGLVVAATIDDGTLVGMARVFTDGAIVSQVVEVAVRPEYQRRGIGRQIMETVRAECHGTALYVDGFRQNAAFFERCGFTQPEMAVFSRRNW